MQFELFPYLLPYFISFIVSLGICGYAWKNSQVAGASIYALSALGQALWTLGYTFELLGTRLETKIFWDSLQFAPPFLVVIANLAFALTYAEQIQHYPKRFWWSLAIIALIFSLIALTDPFHGLIYGNARLISVEPFDALTYDYTWITWGMFLYMYVIAFAALYFLVRQVIRSRDLYRTQAGIILVGSLIPVLVSLLGMVNITLAGQRDIAPLSFAVGNIVVVWGLFRYRIFDLVPIARDTLIENLPDGVVVIDTQDRIVEMNAAARKALPIGTQQFIGLNAAAVFKPAPHILEHVRNIVEGQTEIMLENPTRYFDVQFTRVLDRRQRIVGRLITWRDITDRKQAEIEREQLIVDLESFAYTVAHDLKNPVTTLAGYSSILLDMFDMDDPLPKDEMQDYLLRINQHSLKLGAIIDELLLLTRIRSHAQIETCPLDMAAIVAEVIGRLAFQIRQSNAHIILPAQWFAAIGYPPWIEQVWVNYLSNAINYGGKPPRIQLGAERLPHNGKVRFWVSDNGRGLTDSEQARLFQPFERLAQVQIQGHGLGLSIVRRIIERLNGEVSVSSQVGQGSTFSFTLPAVDEPSHTTPNDH